MLQLLLNISSPHLGFLYWSRRNPIHEATFWWSENCSSADSDLCYPAVWSCSILFVWRDWCSIRPPVQNCCWKYPWTTFSPCFHAYAKMHARIHAHGTCPPIIVYCGWFVFVMVLNFWCEDMIRRLADMANTQFITTTFRPELVKVADKIYGVTHKNRVSHVNVVSKEQALDFIEHDQSHNADWSVSPVSSHTVLCLRSLLVHSPHLCLMYLFLALITVPYVYFLNTLQ